MIARILSRIAARHLGRRSHLRTVSAHDRIVARTIWLRDQLGLPNDERLA